MLLWAGIVNDWRYLRYLRWRGWTWAAKATLLLSLRCTVRAWMLEPWVDVEPDWEDREN